MILAVSTELVEFLDGICPLCLPVGLRLPVSHKHTLRLGLLRIVPPRDLAMNAAIQTDHVICAMEREPAEFSLILGILVHQVMPVLTRTSRPLLSLERSETLVALDTTGGWARLRPCRAGRFIVQKFVKTASKPYQEQGSQNDDFGTHQGPAYHEDVPDFSHSRQP